MTVVQGTHCNDSSAGRALRKHIPGRRYRTPCGIGVRTTLGRIVAAEMANDVNIDMNTPPRKRREVPTSCCRALERSFSVKLGADRHRLTCTVAAPLALVACVTRLKSRGYWPRDMAWRERHVPC